jgi:hypothetical protein
MSMDTHNWPMVDVLDLRALRSCRLWLQFSEGSEGVCDLSTVIERDGPMVRPLRNTDYFGRVFLENGAPTWPNGFDLDPINLYVELSDSGLLVHMPTEMRKTNMPELNDVLISEVGGAGRWGQFSATFDVVRAYFETEPEEPYEIRIRHVASDGSLEAEERPAVIYKESRNWAFEIRAAQDLSYPGKSTRPIVVFLKSSGGVFFYRLLMPGDSKYKQIAGYLSKMYAGPSNRLRRRILSAAELKSIWPDSPLWKNWP